MALNPQNPRGPYRKYTEDDRRAVIKRVEQGDSTWNPSWFIVSA